MFDVRIHNQIARHECPLLFATISGAHLYGFPSADSDYDIRGAHVLPLRQVVGLDTGHETIENMGVDDGLEIDLVTHDVRKFFVLLLKNNGYVLEQLLSPLVVHTTPEHAELRSMAPQLITKHHAHHYLGFAATQWKLFQKQTPRRVKPLLYVYRVLLTGLHLMKTGRVESSLTVLNETARLPFVADLIAQKTEGAEKEVFMGADDAFHEAQYTQFVEDLNNARDESRLAEAPTARMALHDLLIRIRTAGDSNECF